jgi:hypothetical protein
MEIPPIPESKTPSGAGVAKKNTPFGILCPFSKTGNNKGKFALPLMASYLSK